MNNRKNKYILRDYNDIKVQNIQKRLYPQFPTNNQEYDVLLLDPPWKYTSHSQKSNIPPYNTLSFNELTFLPIRRVAKQDCILLLWSTGPMLDKAISLIKIYGFRYITIFQNWIKLQNGQPAIIKSNYSNASSEFLLWAERGRTQNLKTPDQVEQVIQTEITKHSEKPYEVFFPRLMQKLHLNKIKCLEIFARTQNIRYFDVYGDELQPRFQQYKKVQSKVNNISLQNNLRINEIKSKIQFDIADEIITKIIQNHDQAFALSKNELGQTPIAKHNIRLSINAIPVRHNPYRLSDKEKEFMEKEINTLLELGCIEPCEATWVMPVIMVKKKDTLDLRMCIDFRSLNKDMIIENYPIPRIDDILKLLGKGKIFSKLDIKSGFWQVAIEENSQQYTSFITPLGTFKWKRMPFGLKNAPATFQRIMEIALRSVLGKTCLVYIDDIIIFSDNIEQHIIDIQQILALLQKANLRVGVEKCEFFKNSIDILGHRIQNGKVSPQDEKVLAIKNISQPENRSQIRSFMGICSYYRSFIENFTQKCEPLLKLQQQKVEFKWTEDCQKSFELMKHELCTKPILQTPQDNGHYILQTDFSEKGLGAVLNQLLPNEHTPKVIEYASRTLRGAEINYPAYEGEVLAIHWALEKFRHYLHGKNFTLYTDNKALSQVLTLQTKSKKIIRWIMDFQDYTFETQHRVGTENANADALSRLLKIPEDINIKLNALNMFISYYTYSQMYQGTRFDKENFDSCNQILSEGVGDLYCKICSSTHTKNPMLICERCGCGFHIACLNPPLKDIPQNAWYCHECLTFNNKQVYKDITMDFNCIDYMLKKLDINKFSDSDLKSIRKRSSQYKILNNRIYYINGEYSVLVPTIAERKLLVLEQHRVLQHPSPKQLLTILRQNFYWFSMEQLIEQVTYDCQVCQARKIQNIPFSTYTPTDKGHQPFHTVSMDLAPELTITQNNNRHLLIMVDNFSKFTILTPLKDKSSQTIADSIYNNLICIFGTPKCIRVDQGTEFKGDVEDLCYRWNISLARATTYHPQSNGLAERMIQVVKRAITAAVNDPEQSLSWDQACYPIQMSINASISRATSLSPYNVIFGKTMDIPNSIIYGLPLEDFQEPTKFELQKYVNEIQSYFQKYNKFIIQRRKQVDAYYKKQYESKTHKKQIIFQPNQLVFVKKANASRWALPNIGPFIFLKYTSKDKKVAVLKNPATNNITKQSTANLSPWKMIIDPEDTQQDQQNIII